MAAGALEVCVVLLLSVSLSLFLRLPYLWSPALDLSRGRVCVCVCVCVCVSECCGCVSVLCARLQETQRLPARMPLVVGLGPGLGPGPRPEVPEACQGSPRQRAPPPPPPTHPPPPRPRRSSSFLEAECGGARGPRGGNPGLQRESGPRPPTPRGAGRQATALSAVGCEGPAAGGACGGGGRALKERGGQKKKKAYSTRYSQAVSHPSTNQARPCLASEIRRDRANLTQLCKV